VGGADRDLAADCAKCADSFVSGSGKLSDTARLLADIEPHERRLSLEIEASDLRFPNSASCAHKIPSNFPD
jgi:hypothetical protein